MLKLPFLSRLRPRSGYDIVAVIAMCAALGTGGAYAAATIGSEEVVDESLTDADIKNGSLAAAIADQSIGAFKLKPSAVWGSHILDGSVSGDDVAESSLEKVPAAAEADHATTAQIADKAATVHSAPIEGYQVVSKSVPGTPDGPETITGTVSCPAGKRVLGGTYQVDHPHVEDDSLWLVPDRAETEILGINNQFRVTASHPHFDVTYAGIPIALVIQATCAEVE
jgi:hypothetical protein